jgi:hypothetical protein
MCIGGHRFGVWTCQYQNKAMTERVSVRRTRWCCGSATCRPAHLRICPCRTRPEEGRGSAGAARTNVLRALFRGDDPRCSKTGTDEICEAARIALQTVRRGAANRWLSAMTGFFRSRRCRVQLDQRRAAAPAWVRAEFMQAPGTVAGMQVARRANGRVRRQPEEHGGVTGP